MESARLWFHKLVNFLHRVLLTSQILASDPFLDILVDPSTLARSTETLVCVLELHMSATPAAGAFDEWPRLERKDVACQRLQTLCSL